MTSKTIHTDNNTFQVNELSVLDLRAWHERLTLPGGECDLVNENAVPGISLEDLGLICQCDVAGFGDLTARELNQLAEAARELNPHFFSLRALIAETMQKIIDAVTFGLPAADQETSHG